MENKDIQYFLYARRSMAKKDGEEKVASIDSQLNEMVALAKKESLNPKLLAAKKRKVAKKAKKATKKRR